MLALSRQGLPMLRERHSDENRSARGAYVLRDVGERRDVTLIATGSEVEIAVEAADILAGENIACSVVSIPCWEKFEAQDESYRGEVLGTAPRIGIEAAARFGWDRWIGADGVFIGMDGFGASAPAGDLYDHFGITAGAVVDAARALVVERAA